jgi:hypothetical protein
MPKQRRKLSLREQIFNEKVKAWTLYNRMQVQKVLENTSANEQQDLYHSFAKIYRMWGGVEFVNWLRAVGEICRNNDKDIENFVLFHLPKRNESDAKKIHNLKVVAKQMGLDVEITKK